MVDTNLCAFEIGRKEKEKQTEVTNITFDYEDDRWFIRKGFVIDKQNVRNYYLLLAFGKKYALDKNKTQLKQDFYNNDLLNLQKINETFKDMPEDFVSLVTSVIRTIMMSKCERFIDYLDYINKLIFHKLLILFYLID